MKKEIKTCLFCQTENEYQFDVEENKDQQDKGIADYQCRHCGMALPDKHPNDRKPKIAFFVKAFWLIVLFCLCMVIYLPR